MYRRKKRETTQILLGKMKRGGGEVMVSGFFVIKCGHEPKWVGSGGGPISQGDRTSKNKILLRREKKYNVERSCNRKEGDISPSSTAGLSS